MFRQETILKDGRIILEAVMPGVIRCVHTRDGRIRPPSELIALRPADENDAECLPDGVRSGRLAAQVHPADGRITWSAGQGILLREAGHELEPQEIVRYTTGGEAPEIERIRTVDGERSFIRNLKPTETRQAYRAKIRFDFAPGEGIYGLGQGEDGVWNWRGHTQYLYQHNMRIPMPFFLSDRGYGLLADCGCLMTFRDDPEGGTLELDTVDQLDYYVIAGGYGEVIAALRKLTGRAPLLPRWAFGYIQSKERYRTAAELEEVGCRYRKLKVPLDCVVQDWLTWEDGHWGEKRLDRKRYGDLRARTDALHRMHVHTMVSVWPNMSDNTEDYREMLEAGYLLNDLNTYDAFSEDARRLYWKQAERELFSGGFDAWWCDSSEPFTGPDWNGETKRPEEERYRLVGGEHKRMLPPEKANLYAAAHARGIYENQRAAAPDRRVVNLTRSGWVSSQRYGAVLWSGDISARWPVLKAQITEALNVSASGYPWWTLDAGGFFVVRENWRARGCGAENDPTMKWFWNGEFEMGLEDPGYRELYVRWLQFACFLPVFRSHGTDVPREIWQFGEKGTVFFEAIRKTIRLRYSLMPYIYSLAGAVWREDGMMIRPLLADFPEDPKAAACGTEYMFGPSLLVCPVTEPMLYAPGGVPMGWEQAWECYLPAGCGWIDFRDGRAYAGGQTVKVPAPPDSIPVFVQAGSIIPMAEGLQYADQPPKDGLEIRVYPGADAAFTLYEDAGDGYGYERGEYTLTQLTWNEETKTLSPVRGDMRIRIM